MPIHGRDLSLPGNPFHLGARGAVFGDIDPAVGNAVFVEKIDDLDAPRAVRLDVEDGEFGAANGKG